MKRRGVVGAAAFYWGFFWIGSSVGGSARPRGLHHWRLLWPSDGQGSWPGTPRDSYPPSHSWESVALKSFPFTSSSLSRNSSLVSTTMADSRCWTVKIKTPTTPVLDVTNPPRVTGTEPTKLFVGFLPSSRWLHGRGKIILVFFWVGEY